MKSPWNQSADTPAADGEPTHEQKLEELAAALQGADSEDAVPAEAPDADDEEAGEDEQQSELFDASAADDADDDDDEVADPDAADPDEQLFDDPEEDEPKIPKGWTKGTYKRLGKVISQRNELRDTVAEINAKLAKAEGLAGVLHEKYAQFEDPAKQARLDIRFMEALEQLATANPDVNAFAERIVEYVNTGRFSVPDASNPNPTPRITSDTPAPEPQRDERVDRIVRRDAQREVDTTLASLGVKPSFQKLIGDSILDDPKLDLTTVDRSTVVSRAKEFIKANGFTAAEVLAKAAPKSDDPKPPTGGSGGRPTPTPSRKRVQARQGGGEQGGGDSSAPKTLDEWEQRHNERMRSFDQ